MIKVNQPSNNPKIQKVILMKILTLLFCSVIVTKAIGITHGFVFNDQVWNGVSGDEYIDLRVQCELILKEKQWDSYIWPKNNESAKPSFDQVINSSTMRTTVLQSLKLESLLSEKFDFNITSDVLQNELDRIKSKTKDPKNLNDLFSRLNNSPNTFAECVARPALVQKLLFERFSFDQVIHRNTRIRAESELNTNQHNSHSILYVSDGAFEEQSNNGNVHQLSVNQYDLESKRENINSELTETISSFYLEELIESTSNSLLIKKYHWPKQNFHQWVEEQTNYVVSSKSLNYQFNFSEVDNVPNSSEIITGDTWRLRSAPEIRTRHVAIWTGTEMLVWGGIDTESEPVNTGGIYNPTTDTWRTMTSINSPSGRREFSAVWTGNEMIVFGGVSSENPNITNTGGIYNPITDTWRSTTQTNAPSRRYTHTAIWTGTEMVVWGGIDFFGEITNTGGKYNPNTDTWTQTSTSGVTGLSQHKTVWTGTEMLVWGGFSNGAPFNQGYKYNLQTDSWIPMTLDGAPPSFTIDQSAVWTGDEMIIWLGNVSSSNGIPGYRYNPLTDSWTGLSNENGPNGVLFSNAILADDKLIVGGIGTYFADYSMSIYDLNTDTWQNASTTNAPILQGNYSLIWTGEELISWGGRSINSGGIYNPETDEWRESALTKSSFKEGSSHWTGNVVIGLTINPTHNEDGNEFMSYEPKSDTWSFLRPFPEYISSSAESIFEREEVWTGSEFFIFYEKPLTNQIDVYKYDLVLDQWTYYSNYVFSELYKTSSVWTGEKAFIWNDVESKLFDPLNNLWQEVSSINSPTERSTPHSLWTGSDVIIWGQYLNTGATYNLESNIWNNISNVNAPMQSLTNTATWTGQGMIIYGGSNTSPFPDPLDIRSMWLKNTNSWQELETLNSPELRYDHSAIWTDQEMIVFGGRQGANDFQIINTGGRYDPNLNSWSSTSTTNAPVISGHKALWTGDEMVVISFRNVDVYYPYSNHSIGGTVDGLLGGNFSISNNNIDDLDINSNGSFDFSQRIFSGYEYSVSITSQPTLPNQNCVISNASGTVNGDVTDIMINCETLRYQIGGTVSNLLDQNQITISNNGIDQLQVSQNGPFVFAQSQDDGSSYQVQVVTQPQNQTCLVSGGNGNNNDGTGMLLGSDDTSIVITCNTAPDTILDSYTILEDTLLIADDLDGSVNDENDDGLLVNDSDIDSDTLFVVDPKLFIANGIGGFIDINAQGAMSYLPPQDLSGQASLTLMITDGFNQTSSDIQIQVLPVNDAPEFNIQGDIVLPSEQGNQLEVLNFATDIVLGPDNESDQSILQFNLEVISDISDLIQSASLSNDGTLNVILNDNSGVAIIKVNLQDDGGIANGGQDTSDYKTFVINTEGNIIFKNSFEN